LDPPASVDAVVPVHNEQGALAASIRGLQDSLSTDVPFAWRIVIADNASTDETPRVTAALTEDLERGGRQPKRERPGRDLRWGRANHARCKARA